MDSYELLDPQQLIQLAASELKSTLGKVPNIDRAAIEAKIQNAERMLEMARSKSAKDLGYRLHDCKFPPALFIWHEQQQAHVCEHCGNTRRPPKAQRVSSQSSWVRSRQGY